MSQDKTIPADLLLCFECGVTCPCLIYGRKIQHVHMPGGDERYPLCERCQARFLRRHRRLKPTVVWLDACAKGCPYDDIRLSVNPWDGISKEAR